MEGGNPNDYQYDTLQNQNDAAESQYKIQQVNDSSRFNQEEEKARLLDQQNDEDDQIADEEFKTPDTKKIDIEANIKQPNPFLIKQTAKNATDDSNNMMFNQTDPPTASKGNQNKFMEFLLAEKQRKYVRIPRLYGKRKAATFKCPYCKKDKELQTKLKYECTGNQWCACILFCFFGCYPLCCVPFCIKRCYNVKHMCPNCYQQIGESGI